MKYAPFTDRQLLEGIISEPEEFVREYGQTLKNDVLGLAHKYVEECGGFADLLATLDEDREKAHRKRLHLERWILAYIRRRVVELVKTRGKERERLPVDPSISLRKLGRSRRS